MLNRWTIFLSIIALALLGWLYQLRNESAVSAGLIIESAQHSPSTPTYAGENLKSLVFDEKGDLQYEAKAKRVLHFDQTDTTDFQQPIIVLYTQADDKTLPSWRLTANDATLTKQHLLSLTQNVVITNLSPNAHFSLLKTVAAQVNLRSGDVISNRTVELFGPQWYSVGQGLHGNFKQKIATLINQVQTHYDVQPTL